MLSCGYEGEIQAFLDKQKLGAFVTLDLPDKKYQNKFLYLK